MRFTVRRPASAEVSPCCHRPSGGDVACGVHVGITRPCATGDALKNRLALTVFRRDMATVRASLRRIRCRDALEPPRGLVLQPGHQQSPALAADLAVEAAFLRDAGARMFTGAACRAGHRVHLQVLDADGVEPARQIGGGLLYPVTAAICLAGAQSGNGELGSCAPGRSALRPSQTLLQPAQPFGFADTKARSAQQLAAGQGHRDRHAAIHTHHAAITRSREGVRYHGESDVPAPRTAQCDSVGLHGGSDDAGPTEAHPPDFGDPHLPIATVQPPDMPRLDTDVAKSFIPTGLAPRRATMGAVEKISHRLGEVPQRLLLHGVRPGGQPVVFGARRSQLGALLVIPGRMTTWLPVPLLLHGKIPHKTGMATVLGQYRRLLNVGKQPKLGHTKNLGSTTDNPSKGGKRRSLPRVQTGVLAPQNR